MNIFMLSGFGVEFLFSTLQTRNLRVKGPRARESFSQNKEPTFDMKVKWALSEGRRLSISTRYHSIAISRNDMSTSFYCFADNEAKEDKLLLVWLCWAFKDENNLNFLWFWDEQLFCFIFIPLSLWLLWRCIPEMEKKAAHEIRMNINSGFFPRKLHRP